MGQGATWQPPAVFPPAEDLTPLLVRLDRVESWAPHGYLLEVAPPASRLIHRGVLGLLSDGRVIFVQTKMDGEPKRHGHRWIGSLEDLGRARRAPVGFVLAKSLRFHTPRHVHRTSLRLRVAGRRRVISFTGYDATTDPSAFEQLADTAVGFVPVAGPILQAGGAGVRRVMSHSAGPKGIEAAAAWCSVLSGERSASELPACPTDLARLL